MKKTQEMSIKARRRRRRGMFFFGKELLSFNRSHQCHQKGCSFAPAKITLANNHQLRVYGCWNIRTEEELPWMVRIKLIKVTVEQVQYE